MAIRSRNIANVNTPGYKALDVTISEGKAFARPSDAGIPGVQNAGPKDAAATDLPNNVDLVKDLVGLKTDELTAGYNLKAIKAQDRLTGTLLDLVG